MVLMEAEACPVSTTNMQVGNKSLPIRKKTIRHGIRMTMHPTLMQREGMIVLQWVQLATEDKYTAIQALVISRTS
jgi:hypothetical protein